MCHIKLSIVIAVLDSHRAVDRHLRFFEAMPLPDDVELILVDDGSDPPLESFLKSEHRPKNLRMLRNDIDAIWTQPAARNYGAREARGEFLVLTDIDHIVCKPLIDKVASFVRRLLRRPPPTTRTDIKPPGRFARLVDRFGAPFLGIAGPLTIGGWAAAALGVANGVEKVKLIAWLAVGQALVTVTYVYTLTALTR